MLIASLKGWAIHKVMCVSVGYLSRAGASMVTGDGPTKRSEGREEDVQYSVQSGSLGRQAGRRGHQEAPWSTEYSTSTSENSITAVIKLKCFSLVCNS